MTMAAPIDKNWVKRYLALLLVFFSPLCGIYNISCSVLYLEPAEIIDLVKTQCVVVLFSSENQELDDVFLQLTTAFIEEEHVTLGYVHGTPNQFYWSSNEPLQWVSELPELGVTTGSGTGALAIFKRKTVDRSCLISGPAATAKPKAEAYSGPVNAISVLEFTNVKCATYRNIYGKVSTEGLHRKNLLENLFHVGSISSFTLGSWYNCSSNEHDSDDYCGISSHYFENTEQIKAIENDGSGVASNTFDVCPVPTENHVNTEQAKSHTVSNGMNAIPFPPKSDAEHKLPNCERISVPTWETFFDDYLKLSRPVIIEGALKNWPAMTKWRTEFLRHKYGNKEVHIKLAPNGHFEGVEKSSLWEDYATFNIPKEVKEALPYPDLVVVRPATMNLNFSNFLDMMTGNSTLIKKHSHERVSTYLEYSSIPQYLPELEKDIKPFPFVKNKLKRRHLNIWLSDGNTLGKLHFDPFDNLLCQIRGKKELILFEPHDNTNMYEAHIPEAILGFNAETGEFRRKTLLDSTSMVMAPVDILHPDFERFPNFAKVNPLNCTIGEGDVLFMPAFWWHEVQSYPNIKERRNVAVNFWYEPFLIKEFPCPTCQLDVNPYYRHLL